MNIDTDVTMNFFSGERKSGTVSKLFTPVRIGPLTLRNRTIRSAAFEGMCPGNVLPRCYSIIIVQWRQAVLA